MNSRKQMSTIQITLWCCLAFLLLITKNVYALDTVTASIDKNPVMINESIVLTIVADDDVDRNALDTSPLLNDFIVGRTSVSSQTSMVNFKTSRTTQWQVVLIARHAGEMTIPALEIKNKTTTPISLNVLEQSEKAKESLQQDIFVTSQLSSSEVYVQQLVTLTLKLHFSVELKSGSLTEPSLPGATIEKVGQDKQNDTIINGKRYRVVEQTYAITPQQSGNFTLAAPVFSGDIMTAAKRRSSFLSFAQTKPVSVRGDELSLAVKATPTNYPTQDAWLPSELLTLHQEWQKNDDASRKTLFKVGEPITRTVTLSAVGLAKAQLPELKMPSTEGIKVYPDQAQLHTNLTKERLVSQKVQNFALVPSYAGEFTLPEMSITWFNTITNQTQHAILPAQKITVEPGEATITNQNTPIIKTTKTEPTQTAQALTLPQASFIQKESNLTWLFLTLWLLTTLSWLIHIRYLKRNNNAKPSKSNYQRNDQTNANYYLALLAACKKNNANQALSLILPWLNQSIIDPKEKISSIDQAKSQLNDQNFSIALNDLQQHLYGKSVIVDAPPWQGEVLLAFVEQMNKNEKKIKNGHDDFSLNP